MLFNGFSLPSSGDAMAAMTNFPGVAAWRKRVTIPTYVVGEPDPNPRFLEKRVYQGSSGAVYPYPVVESVADEATPRDYDAIFMENEFLKIMILPELGGRVQMAVDKTNGYHFVYYNRVIKPALVGLAGPWISGGIEFNWPQHHRPSTFHPVDSDLVQNDDGSWTAWCHEIDRLAGTKGMHGFTLYPDRAYLEVRVRLFNRTSLPQTFLWWANPAVHADANHQSIFPPDVVAVMDHGKRDVSTFPIATGTYYKVDYSAGVDISRYRNIPVPTSYMAHRSDYDFVGSYDHGRQAGLLHVASHHVSPGKKQWTWGCGDFGKAWDRQLTDDDGPYVELMCGAYTDNQPDFAWLGPGEEKAFTQYFMPYKGVGAIKNATVDAAIGIEVQGTTAILRIYASSAFPNARVVLSDGARTLLDEHANLDPYACREFTAELDADAAERLSAVVYDGSGQQLVAYAPRKIDRSIPAPAEEIGSPASLDSVESLYLAGLHLEQYRHATRNAEDYYREGLRREPTDVRCNVALGRLLLRRGLYREAEQTVRAAVRRSTAHNANPIDGEAHYLLGLTLAAQQETTAAANALHKASWHAAYKSPSYLELARLAIRAGNWGEAKELLVNSLANNQRQHQAIHLLTAALIRLGDHNAAVELANEELAADPFNLGVLYETASLLGDGWELFDWRLRDDGRNYAELAHDYAAAGLYAEAAEVLQHYLTRVGEHLDSAMCLYHAARYADLSGDAATAYDLLLQARHFPRQGFFPNSLEDLAALQWAVAVQDDDHRAWCDLGNLLFSKRRYDEAIACWEQAAELAPDFAQPRRNLGLSYFNKRGDEARSWNSLAEAFRFNQHDARVLFELDQLAKRLQHDPEQRLERLLAHAESVASRDDLELECVTLLNQLGRHNEALDRLLARHFHPWEGGEGRVSAQYVLSLTQLARQALADERADEAIELLQRALDWPLSLGEGKLAGNQENNVYYWLGCAEQLADRDQAAARAFERASRGLGEPSSATYYNDQPPEMIFYQGLAHRALGREYEAVQRFNRLIDFGRQHLDDRPSIDFFAVSLPDFLVFDADLRLANQLHCRYMLALGYLGRRNDDMAAKQFAQVLRLDRNHLGALAHQTFLAAATPPVR